MNNSIFLRLIILSAVLSSLYFRIYKNINTSKDLFWDTMVYYCGPLIFNQQGSGYGKLIECSKDLSDFKFVYLPIYLRLLDFSFVSQEIFQIIWLILLSASIVLIIFILSKIYTEFTFLNCLLISLFSFSAIPFYGYLSGNISNILYAITAAGILMSFSGKKNLITFGLILITIPSLFKIHMILFIMVPLVIVPTSEIRKIFILLPMPFFMILTNKYLYPIEFELLKSNIQILPYVGDMGVGSLQVINYLNSNILNLTDSFSSGRHNWEVNQNAMESGKFFLDYVFYIILILIVFLKTYSLRLKTLSKDLLSDKKLKVSIALIATLMIIPRLKQYDMILFSLPAFYLINSSFFKDSMKNLFNILDSKLIVQSFNILVLGFYVISGDNYFIYPVIVLIYIFCIKGIKKENL